MNEMHSNMALLSALNLRDLSASAELFSDDFVWHYFNPNLPDLEGDFAGIEGLKLFRFGCCRGEISHKNSRSMLR